MDNESIHHMQLNRLSGSPSNKLEDNQLKNCQGRPLEPEEENQQANPQDKTQQYFSENLFHTEIEPALPEDFSPRHLRPYQFTYVIGSDGMHVIGLDIDTDSLEIASSNVTDLDEGEKLKMLINALDFYIDRIVDTVVMNPQFGKWRKGADMDFLFLALKDLPDD
ncbi:putative methyltransferase-like protein 5 [Forsythia ovata]|uniref:Methyltransferase-like protein 5 n=1 Tax=Forsythia ovata TaxID=205694 RepID=A0ABD1S4Y3_9LAMI